ncbi:MAG: twin-arginine translocase TatA/TatE family subunit [Actinomycetes bacterium]|jgi:sec-independent protein translocase protein TatA|nr:twin-arginine translocase TatA/TatE family subunit [Actinomycetes bacterium]
MFNSIGWPEILLILAIVLVIFGPKQLPKLGKMFGKTMKEVRTGIDEATREAQGTAAAEPATVTPEPAVTPAPVAPAPAPEAATTAAVPQPEPGSDPITHP